MGSQLTIISILKSYMHIFTHWELTNSIYLCNTIVTVLHKKLKWFVDVGAPIIGGGGGGGIIVDGSLIHNMIINNIGISTFDLALCDTIVT